MSGLALEGGPTCEVFDFDINSWRHVESPPYKIIDDKYDPTYVDGSLYWFICEENTKRKVLSFYCHTKIFLVISEFLAI